MEARQILLDLTQVALSAKQLDVEREGTYLFLSIVKLARRVDIQAVQGELIPPENTDVVVELHTFGKLDDVSIPPVIGCPCDSAEQNLFRGIESIEPTQVMNGETHVRCVVDTPLQPALSGC